MSSLNETLFEMYLEDEIDVDTLLESVDIDADLEDDEMVEEGANIDSAKVSAEYRKKFMEAKKDYRRAVAKHDYPAAGRALQKMEELADEAIEMIKGIYDKEEQRFVSMVFGNACVMMAESIALLLSTKVYLSAPSRVTAVLYLYTMINVQTAEIMSFIETVKDLAKGKFTFNSFNKVRQNLIRMFVKYKKYVSKASSKLLELNKSGMVKALAKIGDSEASTNESAEEIEEFMTSLYIEGVLDIDDLDIMEDSDIFEEGGCDKGECYDDAIELLKKLKEDPSDKKAKEKLKDIIDDCCDDEDDDNDETPDSEDSSEETPTEESADDVTKITFESEEPIVEEIMESVSEMDRDLKYVDAVLESSIIMTEAPEVLNTIVTEIRNRMKNVNGLLNDLKSKMVKVKDSKVKEKIARILKDLAKRFEALFNSAKSKVDSFEYVEDPQ